MESTKPKTNRHSNGRQDWTETITVESNDFNELECGAGKWCKRQAVFVVMGLVFVACISLAVWLLFGRAECIEYRVKDHRPVERRASGQQAIAGEATETTTAQSEISPPVVVSDTPVTKPARRGGAVQSTQETDAGSSQGGWTSGTRSSGTSTRHSPHHGTTSIYAVDVDTTPQRENTDALTDALPERNAFTPASFSAEGSSRRRSGRP